MSGRDPVEHHFKLTSPVMFGFLNIEHWLGVQSNNEMTDVWDISFLIWEIWAKNTSDVDELKKNNKTDQKSLIITYDNRSIMISRWPRPLNLFRANVDD